MSDIWDVEADAVESGDKLRKVLPLSNKTYKDEEGFTHYVFDKVMFKNPWYSIPEKEFELFKKFVEGGSRAYPSDGSVPCDIVAREARKILNKIKSCAEDSKHHYYQEACECIEKGKKSLLRGTMKIYLSKYTTRDWRRKRFTDDIDFWCYKVNLLEHALKDCGWILNKKTGEWEKIVEWTDPLTKERRENKLFAANNLNQLLDFGAGAYLEGSGLKDVLSKKIKRGHNVDISDVLNIAMVQEKENVEDYNTEWKVAWRAIEEAANTRNTRITSNLISLIRYSLAIANYIDKVRTVLEKYNHLIHDKEEYPEEELKKIVRTSIHWEDFLQKNGFEATRELIHDFLEVQAKEKLHHAESLRLFAQRIMNLLNSKYKHLKIIFEMES